MPVTRSTTTMRPGFARRAALTIAAVLLTVAAGMALWSFVSSRPARRSAADPAPAPTLEPAAGGPLSTQAGINEPPVEELLGGGMGASEQGRLEFVDESGRVVRELFYDRLEPVEGGRVDVTKPEAWVRLPSGAVARLTAERASLRQPSRGREPESGRFAGAVRLALYDTDPRHAADDEIAAAPAVLVETESMNFDASAGEARTADPVRITAAGVEIRFTGFRLIVDDERNRLALFETNSAGVGAIDPAAWRSSGARTDRDDATGADGSATRTLYRAILEGAVAIASGGRSASAGRLDLWARLVDGAPTEAVTASMRELLSSFIRAPHSDPPSAVGAPTEPNTRDRVTFEWADGLSIRALDSAPKELDDEDAHARLTAADGGVVRLIDDSAGLTTISASVDAAIVQQRLSWRGLGPTGVVLRVADGVEAVSGRLDADLITGDVVAPGPGEVRRLGAPAATDRISWRDRAAIRLTPLDGAPGAKPGARIETATFYGAVEATDGRTRLGGDTLETFFTAAPTAATSLTRAVVTGAAVIDAGPDGALSADRLDIEFDPDAADANTPTAATATGSVHAQREGSTLTSELAEVRLRRSPGGGLVVESFTADLDVRIVTADGVHASAENVRATPEAGLADLTGEPAEVALGAGTVRGQSIRIEERARRLTVFGAGTLNLDERNEALGYDRMALSWEDSFTFDDLIGRAEAQGECEIVADAIEPGRDVLTASRVVIDTSPHNARDRGAEPSLLRAVAYGGAGGDNPLDPARIESRRYIPDDSAEGGLRLSTLVALDGPIIEVDAVENRLRVPRPGRLVVEDRRGESDAASTPGAPDEFILNARGTTLAEWEGWMEIDRDTGLAELRQQVRVRHRPPGAPRVTDLECERLEIAFDPGGRDETSASSSALLWAQASGAVYLAQGRRQVIADRLLYDGSLGFAEITAAPGNTVTLFDADSPTPLLGDLLRWDLLRDRLEWRGGRAVTTPD